MPDAPTIFAAQYLRMSREHQRYSIRNQARAIALYAAQHGLSIVKTYTDPGESGLTLRERPGLRLLLADVVKPTRKFDRILVLDVSRWGRFQNLDQSGAYEFICHEAGAPVIYCAEMFENDGSPMMALLKQIKRLQAAEFSRELSEKVLAAQILQARIGHKMGGTRRFGFERVLVDEKDQRLQILPSGHTKALSSQRVVYAAGSPAEVSVIRDIFAWYTRDKLSLPQIARRLNEQGVPAGDGVNWKEGRVRLLLSDELVLGNYVFNRTSQKLKGKRRKNPPDALVKTKMMEPIISRALFDIAARRLRIRRHRVPPEENLAAVARLYRSKGYLTGRLIDQCPYTPGMSALLKQFGSIHRVYELIGYKPVGWWRPPDGKRPATKGELLLLLKGLFERDGYVTEATINRDPALPSVSLYKYHFGSVSEAYRQAGLPYRRIELQRLGFERLRARRAGEPPRKISKPRWLSQDDRYSDDDLLNCLRNLQRRHGYVTAKIIREDRDSPTPSAFIRRFGSLLEAYGRAGLENKRANICSRAAQERARQTAERRLHEAAQQRRTV